MTATLISRALARLKEQKTFTPYLWVKTNTEGYAALRNIQKDRPDIILAATSGNNAKHYTAQLRGTPVYNISRLAHILAKTGDDATIVILDAGCLRHGTMAAAILHSRPILLLTDQTDDILPDGCLSQRMPDNPSLAVRAVNHAIPANVATLTISEKETTITFHSAIDTLIPGTYTLSR